MKTIFLFLLLSSTSLLAQPRICPPGAFTGTFTGNGAGLTNLNLPFAPATNTIVYITNVTGITNASGVVTNLAFTLDTNTIYYQQR